MNNIAKKVKNQLKIIQNKTAKIINEEELERKLYNSIKNKKPLRVKLGIDPTASDIHLGFTLVLKKLKDFQNLNHKIFLIIGDFTAKIGDPSGRNNARPPLSDREIKNNMKTYLQQVFKILNKNKTEIKYNSEWLAKLTLKEILTILSKITIQKITEREDFKKRINENNPVFLHEIIYPLLQAYDSVYLRADIELGGLDQELNCLMGRELQVKFGQEPQVVILMPLLIGLDGKYKMSKSRGNYIGINETPDEIFGKTMSIPDNLIENWLKLATDLPEKEIKRILKLHPMEAKKRLAYEIVKIYHNKELALKALKKFEQTFQKKDYQDLAKELTLSDYHKNLTLIDLLCQLNLVKSKSEARRLIEQGAIEINNTKIFLNDVWVLNNNLKSGDIIRIGKKNFYRIKIEK
ncbi:MAG: tyrosine--tRNA ligase [Patescibacteria group bacterium]|nr:tyrosine--tRNA ligase [Patescibacteria group bacterium]